MEHQQLFAKTTNGSFKFHDVNGQHPVSLHLVKRWVVGALLVSALSGCVPTADESADRLDSITNTNEVNDVVVSAEAINQPLIGTSTDQDTPDDGLADDGLADDAQVANNTDSELELLLYTDFETENQQLIPTTGWICEDADEQNRVYYFYPVGVLAASRKVAVERTLNENNTFDDKTFFWELSGADSILLSTVFQTDNGNLLFAGEQYDVNTIRFTEVEDRQTFTAQSMLRGQMACAAFNLR